MEHPRRAPIAPRAIAPVRRTKADARRTYDRRSRSYERIEGRFERRARTAGEALLAVQPGERVLEIGSGPGESLVDIARATGPSGHVVGLDLAPQMQRSASARLRDAGLRESVSLVIGDGASLPLRAGSVDAAFTCFTLELFDTPDLPRVLAEIRRTLRPAGRLAVVSLAATEPPAVMERLYLVAHRLLPRLADCRPIPLGDLVSDAGFRITERRRCDVARIPVEVLAAVAR